MMLATIRGRHLDGRTVLRLGLGVVCLLCVLVLVAGCASALENAMDAAEHQMDRSPEQRDS